VIEPTSLRRWEGLVAVFLRVVGMELRCRGGAGEVGGGRGMREDKPKSTVMWLMAFLNSASPHR